MPDACAFHPGHASPYIPAIRMPTRLATPTLAAVSDQRFNGRRTSKRENQATSHIAFSLFRACKRGCVSLCARAGRKRWCIHPPPHVGPTSSIPSHLCSPCALQPTLSTHPAPTNNLLRTGRAAGLSHRREQSQRAVPAEHLRAHWARGSSHVRVKRQRSTRIHLRLTAPGEART